MISLLIIIGGTLEEFVLATNDLYRLGISEVVLESDVEVALELAAKNSYDFIVCESEALDLFQRFNAKEMIRNRDGKIIGIL